MYNADKIILVYSVPHLGKYSIDEELVVYREQEKIVNTNSLNDAKLTLTKVIQKDREKLIGKLRKEISDLELQTQDIEVYKSRKIWD